MEVTWKESLPVSVSNPESLLAPGRAMANIAYPPAVLREALALFEPQQA